MRAPPPCLAVQIGRPAPLKPIGWDFRLIPRKSPVRLVSGCSAAGAGFELSRALAGIAAHDVTTRPAIPTATTAAATAAAAGIDLTERCCRRAGGPPRTNAWPAAAAARGPSACCVGASGDCPEPAAGRSGFRGPAAPRAFQSAGFHVAAQAPVRRSRHRHRHTAALSDSTATAVTNPSCRLAGQLTAGSGLVSASSRDLDHRDSLLRIRPPPSSPAPRVPYAASAASSVPSPPLTARTGLPCTPHRRLPPHRLPSPSHRHQQNPLKGGQQKPLNVLEPHPGSGSELYGMEHGHRTFDLAAAEYASESEYDGGDGASSVPSTPWHQHQVVAEEPGREAAAAAAEAAAEAADHDGGTESAGLVIHLRSERPTATHFAPLHHALPDSCVCCSTAG